MSTVNFSIPEEVKSAFNETFEGQNQRSSCCKVGP